MSHSKLSDHKFKKGKFIAPLNEIENLATLKNNESWYSGRLPEYMWIGLILDKYGRTIGLRKLYYIIKKLHSIEPSINSPRFSLILSMDEQKQKEFYDYLLTEIDKNTLCPLTLIFTYSEHPIFSKYFVNIDMDIQERADILKENLAKYSNHQSNDSTDIRFIVLYYSCMTGQLHLLGNQIKLLSKYYTLSHDDEQMRIIRPTIRSTELIILVNEKKSDWYLNIFWRRISIMTDCELYSLNYENELANTQLYMEQLHEVFDYLSELLCNSNPLDQKMLVLFGLATYSYKRILEVVEHNLFNSISGRSAVRILIENYIMIKYLVKIEPEHEDIWTEYQVYGMGQYKLILSRFREQEESEDLKNSHVNYKYLECLVNEFFTEEMIDMDTRYFDKQNIREKAKQVGEQILYGLYYDYDSAYEHGLWGAIRESSLLKCKNPAHQYHCVPDIDNNQKLKSVWYDCVFVMEKILLFLDDIYGIPKELLSEVINNGQKFFE